MNTSEEIIARARFKTMLGEVLWTIFLGLLLGVGFAFGWWLVS
jgi:hypothetical protein